MIETRERCWNQTFGHFQWKRWWKKDFSTFFIQENKVLTAFIWDKTTSKPCGHKSAYLHKISVGLEHKGTSLNFYLNWSLRQQKDHWWHPRCGPALFHSTLPPTAQSSCTLKLIFLHAEPKVCSLTSGSRKNQYAMLKWDSLLCGRREGQTVPRRENTYGDHCCQSTSVDDWLFQLKLERWLSQTEQQTENVQHFEKLPGRFLSGP